MEGLSVNRFLLSVFIGLMSLTFVAGVADAKRLGGGTSSGMKRQAPPPATPAQQTPAKQATAPANSAAPAAAAAPKRSWMGPIAGIAAGLGLAALMSHLGLGAEFGNILTMLLLAAVAFFVIRWAMRRFGPQPAAPARGLQFAGAGAPAHSPGPAFGSGSGSAMPGSASAPAFGGNAAPVEAAPFTPAVPAGFDAAGFERIAKLIFIRMQAANDAANLDDLRQFSTPEMFANFRLDLQERGATGQQTDVVQLDAQVLEMAEEDSQQIVSVRFHGLIRETPDAPAEPFDEVWHLARPLDGSREWAIAGIAQRQ
jgi:predicted lipid-binding transport protein (Tim44 family)